MSRVFIKESTYDYSHLRSSIFDILDSTASGLISRGSRVLLKPNLLTAAPPEKAVVTHPHVVRAIAEYVFHKGGRVQVSDSPAVGTFEKIIRQSGYITALEGLPVELTEFKKSVLVDTGKPFGKIEVACDPVQADVVINLPKLKTHTQMLLTLGIKNTFGCVIGMKKPEWHLRAGADREVFASLLVSVFQAIGPSVTILDGILAMEGQGPGRGGIPRELNLLMGSSDTVAIDITVCRLLGILPETLPTNRAAARRGLLNENVELSGSLPYVQDFLLPEATSPLFGPQMFRGFMRRHITQRPFWDKRLCTRCGVCVRFCPASAIGDPDKHLRFNYDRCIRCYCCIEVCPHGALRAEETLVGKISRRLLRMHT